MTSPALLEHNPSLFFIHFCMLLRARSAIIIKTNINITENSINFRVNHDIPWGKQW